MAKEDEESVLQSMGEENLDIQSFDRFVDYWHDLVEDHQLTGQDSKSTPSSKTMLAKVEGVANKLLLDLAARDRQAGEYGTLESEYSSLPGSLLLVSASGTILDTNERARSTLGLRSGDLIQQLAFTLSIEKELETVIAEVAHAQTEENQVVLLRGTKQGESVHNTLSVVHSASLMQNEPRALVILMETQWNSMASALIAGNFKLTETEIQIIEAFVAGHNLKEIASQRQRSYITIRNQFQSVLDKTGSNSQAELLNLLLTVSTMFANIVSPTQSREKKSRRQYEIMRPHGRFVDVRLYGDLRGTPVISVPSIFGHAITPENNKVLHQAGLKLIAIAPPGYGDTSFEQKGTDHFNCLAEDIVAVLDSLEIDSCIFLGGASAARSMFRLGGMIPNRMQGAYMINSMVPQNLIPDRSTLSKWSSSLLSASRVSSGVASLLLGSGKRLLLRIGAPRFIGKMYEGSPIDQVVVKDSNVANSIEMGVSYTTTQGVYATTRDMLKNFEDWTNDVKNTRMRVTLVEGDTNPQVPITGCRALAKLYPKQVRLIELTGGGGLLKYTHFNEIISIIKADQERT